MSTTTASKTTTTTSKADERPRTRQRKLPPADVVAHAMGWLEPQDVASAASVCKVFASGCASERLWQEQYVRAFGGAPQGGAGARGDEGKGSGSVVAPAPRSALLMPPCAQSKVVCRDEKEGERASTSAGAARKWRQRFARRFRIERNWLSPGTDVSRFSSLTVSGHTANVRAVLVWWERGLVFSGSSDHAIRTSSKVESSLILNKTFDHKKASTRQAKVAHCITSSKAPMCREMGMQVRGAANAR
jgi:hypothetical protein